MIRTLFHSPCRSQLCDFGLARLDFASLRWRRAAVTHYVTSRPHRAPEHLLALGHWVRSQ